MGKRASISKKDIGEIVLKPERMNPQRESWLYENKEALASVRHGLNQARRGEFAGKGPDLKTAAKLADMLQDD